eukprot:scaffold107060_cov17-Tisochrysis_lutea.AAC.2
MECSTWRVRAHQQHNPHSVQPPTSPRLATVRVRLSSRGTRAAKTSGGAMLMSSITTQRPSVTACGNPGPGT